MKNSGMKKDKTSITNRTYFEGNIKTEEDLIIDGRGAPEISRKKTDPGRQFRPQAKVHLPKLVLNKTVHLGRCGLDRSANSFTLSNF